MDERVKFVAAVLAGDRDFAEVCRLFGISRRTGYKWWSRYRGEGAAGLVDRSRSPWRHANQTPQAVEARLVAEKKRRRKWGPKKLVAYLRRIEPETRWPAPSTAARLLDRRRLVTRRRRRSKSPPYAEPMTGATRPNAVWSADFKGQFPVGGPWCYPLTVSDGFSRYLLVCRGLPDTSALGVRPWFEAAFREVGLPLAIRTDSGPPFGSVGLGGLTRLTAWWVRLGICPERIDPGHPEQNGRHERMHRTLKEETASPPRDTWEAQQRAFDRFRVEYNDERPHEALRMRTPADVYQPSERPYPERLPELEYPAGFAVRQVRRSGEIKWRGGLVYASQTLTGEPLGLWQIDNDRWEVYFGFLRVGVLDGRAGRIERPVAGRTPRNGNPNV
jgi:transposase InsO family protein